MPESSLTPCQDESDAGTSAVGEAIAGASRSSATRSTSTRARRGRSRTPCARRTRSTSTAGTRTAPSGSTGSSAPRRRGPRSRGSSARAPDDVAIQTSVSAAVSGARQRAPFGGERNRIVISEYEFPTIGQIAHAQELRGAEVVHVEPRARGVRRRDRRADGARRVDVRLLPDRRACTTSRRSTGSRASTAR